VNLPKLAVRVCANLLSCGLAVLLLTGCAALEPLALSPEAAANEPRPPLSTTNVQLSQANFHVQKLNAEGHSNGFKLLGLFTIVPATRVKAFKRMYHTAGVQPGSALTPAHIVVEQVEQSYILFSIPQVFVRADFVVFENPPCGEPDDH
jgi:hypothetical protein